MAVKISADSAEFGKELKKTNSQLQSFASQFSKIATGAGIVFSADLVKDLAKEIITITAKFQKFQSVLTNTLGSRSAALGAMEDIKQFATQTPFSVDELTSSFVKLVNQGFKPTKNELRSLGDLAASQGKSFDQLTEAIIDAQTGEFERLKEFGIRAKKEGDRVTFTFKGVKEQVDFTAGSIRKYILSLGDAVGVSGSMASVSTTIGGKLSNLGDNLDQILVSIGNRSSGLIGGFLDFANSALGSVNSALNDQVRALSEENVELNALVGAITDVNTTEDVRKKLLTDLNQKYPDFLKNLDVEKVTNEQLASRLKDVNDQFQRKILLAASEKELVKAQEKAIELLNREADARVQLQKIKNGDYQAAPVMGAGPQFETNAQKERILVTTLEEKITKAQEARAEVQKELNDRIRQYSEALGIFNTTNNDYFVQTEKNTQATQSFSRSVSDLKKQLQYQPSNELGGDEMTPFETPEFSDEFWQMHRQKIEDEFFTPFKQQWEEAHGIVEGATIDMSVTTEEMANRMSDAWLSVSESIGEAMGSMVFAQESFRQALANSVKSIIDNLKRIAIAQIIANAARSGKNPIAAIALASFGFAAISALFSKIGGAGSGAGVSGNSSVNNRSSAISGTGVQDSKTVQVEVTGVIRGQDIWLSGSNTELANKFLKTTRG